MPKQCRREWKIKSMWKVTSKLSQEQNTHTNQQKSESSQACCCFLAQVGQSFPCCTGRRQPWRFSISNFPWNLSFRQFFYALETQREVVVAVHHWMPTSGCRAQNLLLFPAVLEQLIPWGVRVYAQQAQLFPTVKLQNYRAVCSICCKYINI